MFLAQVSVAQGSSSTSATCWSLACRSLAEEAVSSRVLTPRRGTKAVVCLMSLRLRLRSWAHILLQWVSISIEHFFSWGLRDLLVTHLERFRALLGSWPRSLNSWSLISSFFCPRSSITWLIALIRSSTESWTRSSSRNWSSWHLLKKNIRMSFECLSHAILLKWIFLLGWSCSSSLAAIRSLFHLDLCYSSRLPPIVLTAWPWSIWTSYSWLPRRPWRRWLWIFKLFEAYMLDSSSSASSWSIWSATFNTVITSWKIRSLLSNWEWRNEIRNLRRFVLLFLLRSVHLSWRR